MSEQKKRKLDRLIERMRHNNNNNLAVAVDEDTPVHVVKIGGCRLCDRSFSSENDLLTHIVDHYPDNFYLSHDEHSGKEKENERKSIEAEIRRVAETKSFKADKNGVIVDRDRCLSQDSPTMVERIRNGPSSSKSDSPTDLPYFMCPECCLTFSDSDVYNAHLDQHMLWHVTQRLTNLTQSKHFRCIQCDANFADVQRYQEHLKCHVSAQESVCIVCGQTFGTQFELNLHMGSHTGGTYDCKQCGKCFENRKALTQHLKAQHQTTCPECALVVGSRSELNDHLFASHESKNSGAEDNTRDNRTPVSTVSGSVTPVAIVAPRTPSSGDSLSDQTPPAGTGRCARVVDKGAMNNAYLDGLLEDICAKQDKKRKMPAAPIAMNGGRTLDLLTAAVSPKLVGVKVPVAFSSVGPLESDVALQNDYLNSVLETNVRRYNRERPRSFAQREEESLNAADSRSKEAMFALFQLAMRAASSPSATKL